MELNIKQNMNKEDYKEFLNRQRKTQKKCQRISTKHKH